MDPTLPPEVAKALLAVQKEVALLDFPKTANNPHFSSKYCPLDVVMEKVTPVLNKHGFVFLTLPTVITNGNGYEPGLRGVLIHESGVVAAEDTMALLPAKLNAQAQGAAITYGRRYFIQSLLGITPEDDVDGNAPNAPREADSPAGFDGPSPI